MEVLKHVSKKLVLSSVVVMALVAPCIASAGTIRKPPTNLGLTMYLPMDEGRGTTVSDTSGNKWTYRFATGALANPPSWTNGKRGKALYFGGNTASLTSASSTAPRLNQLITNATGTISVWVRPAAASTIPGAVYDVPAVFSDGGGYIGIHQGIVNALDRLWVYNYDTLEDVVGVTYTPGEWVHITWVHANGMLYAYKNGELVGSTPSGNTGLVNQLITIGRNYGNVYFNGDIDELRTYNRELSASEIKRLYQAGAARINVARTSTVGKTITPSGSLQSGLVAHYTFDGKDMYNNVADVSGNGRNGTISGQAATSTTIGKIGQALNFDGTNDYVDLGNNAAFEPSGSTSFSVAFWYKGLKGSTEHFVSHSPSPATNYWFIDHDSAQFCGGNGCGQSRINSYTLPNDNDWHHLAVVLDRSTSPDQLKVYLDGVSTGTQSGALDGNSTTWATNTRIGAPYWASSGYRQGPMDDVRFYNRALSAAEAKQLYLLGK